MSERTPLTEAHAELSQAVEQYESAGLPEGLYPNHGEVQTDGVHVQYDAQWRGKNPGVLGTKTVNGKFERPRLQTDHVSVEAPAGKYTTSIGYDHRDDESFGKEPGIKRNGEVVITKPEYVDRAAEILARHATKKIGAATVKNAASLKRAAA